MPPPTQGPENFVTTDEIIGICIIVIGITICIIRLLCIKQKRRKKSKGSENLNFQPDELPLKKTAADHLEELKEATQRVARSLSVHTPKESHSPLDNSSLFSLSEAEKRKSSPNVNSMRSSKSFSKKVGPRLISHRISKSNSKHSSRVVSLRRSSLTTKSQKRFPPTPPPSPLKFQDDIIEVDPIRMSLVNTLLSNVSKSTYSLPSSSKTSSRVPSKVQSRTELQIEPIQSRMGSRASSNSSISSQSTSSPSRISL